MGCFVVAEFLLISVSRCPSAIEQLLVEVTQKFRIRLGLHFNIYRILEYYSYN